MVHNIIAIGGGSFKEGKSALIDAEIINMSGKSNPKLLFIPTASSDDENYCDSITNHFQNLGCQVDILRLIKQKPTLDVMQAKIQAANIIYVGGGNTLKMMNLWRKTFYSSKPQARQSIVRCKCWAHLLVRPRKLGFT